MRKTSILILAGVGALLLLGTAVVVHGPRPSVGASRRSTEILPSLQFHELLDPGPTLRPSDKALSLHGKRVRVVGFMAEMEAPIEGGFYLVPRAMRLDESGGGTGDLPLESILVVVPGTAGKSLPHVEGPLEGVGVLEVGNRADEQGRVSNFRLSLDRSPAPRAQAKQAAQAPPHEASQPHAALAASRK